MWRCKAESKASKVLWRGFQDDESLRPRSCTCSENGLDSNQLVILDHNIEIQVVRKAERARPTDALEEYSLTPWATNIVATPT